jgi:hypothetical protein
VVVDDASTTAASLQKRWRSEQRAARSPGVRCMIEAHRPARASHRAVHRRHAWPSSAPVYLAVMGRGTLAARIETLVPQLLRHGTARRASEADLARWRAATWPAGSTAGSSLAVRVGALFCPSTAEVKGKAAERLERASLLRGRLTDPLSGFFVVRRAFLRTGWCRNSTAVASSDPDRSLIAVRRAATSGSGRAAPPHVEVRAHGAKASSAHAWSPEFFTKLVALSNI